MNRERTQSSHNNAGFYLHPMDEDLVSHSFLAIMKVRICVTFLQSAMCPTENQ